MSDELVEVLDEKGNKTGRVLPRHELHEQELWHSSAFVWVYNSKGEVLIQFRTKDRRSFPNVWDVSAAGHTLVGDSPLDGAVREVREEIGLKISKSELIKVAQIPDITHFIGGRKHLQFCWVYILHKDVDLHDLKIQKEELSKIKWISIKDLIAELKDPKKSKAYAGRNIQIYESAFNEIQSQLGKNWGEL